METRKRDKRKMLLVLPLLVMPFLTLAFYAAGGGRQNLAVGGMASKGINTALPDATFKTAEPVDKMGFYARAGKDTTGENGIAGVAARMGFNGGLDNDKTLEINSKLLALNKEINAPGLAGDGTRLNAVGQMGGADHRDAGGMKEDVDRLELLMESMKSDKGRDPEMEQMNVMLERILEIQHPGRAQKEVVSSAEGSALEKEFLAVPAEISDGMKVVNGATIRLRLLDSVVLKHVVLPKGLDVFGICRLVNQRLLLDIKNIRLGNAIVPVDLSVFGLDGMLGISAPDAIFGEVASAGAVDAFGGISVYGMEGVAGQVAGAGIDAAKSLFSKKVRVVRVRLKAGERVLLRINKP